MDEIDKIVWIRWLPKACPTLDTEKLTESPPACTRDRLHIDAAGMNDDGKTHGSMCVDGPAPFGHGLPRQGPRLPNRPGLIVADAKVRLMTRQKVRPE